MIRPKLRLSTLALLVLIAALICALAVQWRREAELRVEMQRAQAELQRSRAEALQAEYLRRLEAARAAQGPPSPEP